MCGIIYKFESFSFEIFFKPIRKYFTIDSKCLDSIVRCWEKL